MTISSESSLVEPDAGAESNPLLQVDSLMKSFGGINALNGVSFEVSPGTITGLIGPNGAGKSTTFDVITGMITPETGTVTFAGTDVTGQSRNVVSSGHFSQRKNSRI